MSVPIVLVYEGAHCVVEPDIQKHREFSILFRTRPFVSASERCFFCFFEALSTYGTWNNGAPVCSQVLQVGYRKAPRLLAVLAVPCAEYY